MKFKDFLNEGQSPTLKNEFMINNQDDGGTVTRHYFNLTDNIDILTDKKLDDILPIDLGYFPNYMGINLVSVESISWAKQVKDNQLIDFSVQFIPSVDPDLKD